MIRPATRLIPRPIAAGLLALVAAGASFVATGRAQTPAPGSAPTPADAEFEAAAALKKKAAYERAASAFDAWAKAHPDQPRAGEALTEAGVCWYSIGRSKMKDMRNTKESLATFETALDRFQQVVNRGEADQGGRAQYMRGWTKYTMDDPAGAVAEYQLVLERWKDDPKYVPKALERRAMARRSLLQTAGAIDDLQRYVKEFPDGDEIQSVKQYLAYCRTFEKPAPELAPQTWIQGGPTSLQAMRGDVVILVFMATWCENCEAARPRLVELFDRYETMGVRMIGIVDESKGQTVESVRGFLPTSGYRFPVMMDSSKRTRAHYGGSSIPDVVLIDRAGRQRWHDNPANLRDATIDALLFEDPAELVPRPAK